MRDRVDFETILDDAANAESSWAFFRVRFLMEPSTFSWKYVVELWEVTSIHGGLSGARTSTASIMSLTDRPRGGGTIS